MSDSTAAGGEVSVVPELTQRQVKLIKETWDLVAQDLQGAGLVLFLNCSQLGFSYLNLALQAKNVPLSCHSKLFEIAPELQELFPFQGQELNEENTLLKKHALQVMESVGLAISLMGDPEQLQETLIELGIIHNMKSVQVKSFEPVGQALIYALATGLGDHFTDEVKEAWVTLYGIVQHFMEMGMREGLGV